MKKSTMFLSILIFLMLFGACGTLEVGAPPKEPTYTAVTPTVEETSEVEEPEVIEEEVEEVIEEEVIEEEVIEEEPIEEWVEPLEAWQGAIPDEYLENPEEQYEEPVVEYVEPYVEPHVSYGNCLTAWGGVYWFGNQKETWYNLDMTYVVQIAHNNGLVGEYWVREDGCKMFGDYIILACNRDVHPYGSLVETSLGWGISLDTGAFAVNNPYQVDVAVNW